MTKDKSNSNSDFCEYEIRQYERHGVKVFVAIDYANGDITLKDGINRKSGSKNWIFANRHSGYKQGWFNILDAMSYAMDEAFKRLDAEKERRADENAKMIGMVMSQGK